MVLKVLSKLLRGLQLLVLSALPIMFAGHTSAQHPTMNIVETAIAADDFTLLVATLEATGLDEALANEHAKFTVFVPTDAAFQALGKDTIQALLNDTETLSDILFYHVLDKKKPSNKLGNRNGRNMKKVYI